MTSSLNSLSRVTINGIAETCFSERAKGQGEPPFNREPKGYSGIQTQDRA